MQRLCTSTLGARRRVSKGIIPQPSGAGMGKLPRFYANVTASLPDFYGAFMTSLSLSGILPRASARGMSRPLGTPTVAQVQQAGGQALEVTVDVANAQSTQAMAIRTIQRFGRIDILVNN